MSNDQQPVTLEESVAPEYLGDAVYASFDGHHIWLHLDDHRSRGLIALEPEVFSALLAYAHRVWPRGP